MSVHPIGTRVVVQRINDHRPNPSYVGKTATVTEHLGTDTYSHKLRFDDESLGTAGVWSYEALRPIDNEPADSVLEGVTLTGATITTSRPVPKPGDRVRCVDGGIGFPGRVGTVNEENYSGPHRFYVTWDTLPNRDVNSTAPQHGGSWDETGVEVIDPAPVTVTIPGAGWQDLGYVDETDKPDLPDFDTVESAGLDGTNREGGPYTWEDVARAALSDRDELSREYAGFRTRWADERTALTRAVSLERRRLCEEIDDLRAQLATSERLCREDCDKITALRSELDANHAQAVTEGEALYQQINDRDRAIDYCLDLYTNGDDRARVFGYLDGLKAARS